MPDDVVNTGSDELTPGEKAYLESGGENADALRAEQAVAGEVKPEVKADVQPEPKKDAKAEVKDAKADVKAADVKGTDGKAGDAKASAGDDEDEPNDPKATVPYPKYSRERKKLREQITALEKANGELNDKFSRGDERLRLLSEALQQPGAQTEQVDEDPEPDPNEDIIAWANWSRRENIRLREAIGHTQGVVRESAAEQKMREDYQRDAVAFTRETPDFVGAYNYLITARDLMLQEQGYQEAQIRQILYNEEKGLVQRALSERKRPSALIYAMAKQMGYRTPEAAAAANGNSAANGAATNGANGAVKADAGTADKQNGSVVDEIERIQKGINSGKSLSDAGGSANELTVEALATMSDREFAALYASKKGQIDGLLGKRH